MGIDTVDRTLAGKDLAGVLDRAEYIRTRPLSVAEAMCGVTTTLSRLRSVCSGSSGSGAVTSRPAAYTLPESSADQRLRIDHTAAGRIDDDDTVLHSSERRRVEQVPGLIGERGVHRDDPALGQDRVEIDLFVFDDLHIGVADDDAHVHRGAHAGDSTPIRP